MAPVVIQCGHKLYSALGTRDFRMIGETHRLARVKTDRLPGEPTEEVSERGARSTNSAGQNKTTIISVYNSAEQRYRDKPFRQPDEH